MNTPSRADRARAAWAEDAALPHLYTTLDRDGYTQLRARVPRRAMVLTLHLLSSGSVSVELEGRGDDLWRAVAALERVREALGT